MKKNTVGILSGVLLIAGGLILRSLYKKGKLKGVEDLLKPLLNCAKETKEKAEATIQAAN